MTKGYDLFLIKAYDTQKKWKNWNKVHGVYSLTFSVEDARYYQDNTCSVFDSRGNNEIYVFRKIKDILNAFSNGGIKCINGKITIIGEFIKIGASVFFIPLENYNDYI